MYLRLSVSESVCAKDCLCHQRIFCGVGCSTDPLFYKPQVQHATARILFVTARQWSGDSGQSLDHGAKATVAPSVVA